MGTIRTLALAGAGKGSRYNCAQRMIGLVGWQSLIVFGTVLPFVVPSGAAAGLPCSDDVRYRLADAMTSYREAQVYLQDGDSLQAEAEMTNVKHQVHMVAQNIYYCDTAEARIRYALLDFKVASADFPPFDEDRLSEDSPADRDVHLSYMDTIVSAMRADVLDLRKYGYASTDSADYESLKSDLDDHVRELAALRSKPTPTPLPFSTAHFGPDPLATKSP